jgi:hypothetical protein
MIAFVNNIGQTPGNVTVKRQTNAEVKVSTFFCI